VEVAQYVCVRYAGLGSEDEVRLIETLFHKKGYNALIRPVRNLTETVTVKFGLAMIQLINVVRNCSTRVASITPFKPHSTRTHWRIGCVRSCQENT